MSALIAAVLGSLLGSGLSTPMGSCEFDTTVAGSRFHGTLFKCRLEDSSSCSSGKILLYDRGRAQFGDNDVSTREGTLCLPNVGAIPQWSGETIWNGGKRDIAVKFEVTTSLLTANTVTGSIQAEIELIFPLRPSK